MKQNDKRYFEKKLDQLISKIKKITDEVLPNILLWKVDEYIFKNYMEQCKIVNKTFDTIKPYFFQYDDDELLFLKKVLFEAYYDTMITSFNKLHEIFFGYALGEDEISNNEYKFGYVVLEYGISRVFNCKAQNLEKAFNIFGKEMERQFGYNAPDKLILVEVRENGLEVDW